MQKGLARLLSHVGWGAVAGVHFPAAWYRARSIERASVAPVDRAGRS